MPSPFPGMDPFLESPGIFPDLHDSMIGLVRESLNAQLPEPYFAAIASRVWIDNARRHVEPDVDVLKPAANGSASHPSGLSGGQVAVAVKPVVVVVPTEEFREKFIEIRTSHGGERLVTALEILSRANKTPRSMGRRLYRKKQREVMSAPANLVEIDLLRAGRHTTAVPLQRVREMAGEFDYHVCVHCFDRREEFLVYPIPLALRLPVVLVPLLPETPPIPIDLQAAFERAYEVGLYSRRVKYREPLADPILSPVQAAWAEGVLREKGIVPAQSQ